MILPLEAQLQGFFLAAVLGVILGIFYDAIRICRVLLQSPQSQVFWFDVAFMSFAAVLTFLVSLGVSMGEVRWYIVLGEALGFCLYFFTVGMVSVRIARFVKRGLDFCIFHPLQRIFHRIGVFLHGKIEKIFDFFKKRFQKPKKRLKQNKKMLYNHTKGMRTRKPGRLKGHR